MPWACVIDGKSLRLEDIDTGVLGDIGRKWDQDWVRLIYFPCADERAAKELVVKCAEILGVEPPVPADGPWPARVLLDVFEQVPDDLPESLDSQGLPMKAEADGSQTD